MTPEPFSIAIPDAALTDLRARLKATRWPDQIDGIGWEQGTERDYLQSLIAYWADGFDWRATERDLNRLPQFRLRIGGQDIHFIHQRANRPGALPLILSHGWPGSFAEFARLVPMLTAPEAHGGQAEDAFDVVIPSLPGFGFSGRPATRGCNAFAVAELWAQLMTALGYTRFGAQGGDIGAGVSTALALAHPDRLIGLHLNFIPGSLRTGDDPATLTDEEREGLAARAAWAESEGGYSHLHATRPQSLAYALTDSPAGLAGWIVEKFRAWTDCDGDIARALTRDEVLTELAIYWFSQTIASSMRMYWEGRLRPMHLQPGQRVRVPTAIAHFPKELPLPPRRYVERAYDVVRWTEMPRGGHFAALEQPALLVEDIRAFYRPLRAPMFEA